MLFLIFVRLIQNGHMNSELHDYIEEHIIPRYASFDKAHRTDHVRAVISQSLVYAAQYGADEDMAYTVAAYHDTGLTEGRETHHTVSGRIIREDARLRNWFSEEQIETMAQAAEDHRASAGHEPRSIYGRIVAEADRVIDPLTIIRRTVQYSLSHHPDLDMEGHWERCLGHLREKYAEGGYLKLWIPDSPNGERLSALREIIRDHGRLRRLFEREYSVESKTVRAARVEDLPRMMELMASAKAIMRADGNMTQWSGPYPDEAALMKDISLGHSFVIEDAGGICGTFAYIEGIDPTYLHIEGGQWTDDTLPYAVIHRIASTADSHGVAEACFRWCWEHCQNLRIDTHKDNSIMRHVISGFGFSYCGIIHVADGTERLAYQKI